MASIAMFTAVVQPRRHAERVLAADHDERVHAQASQVVLDPLHPGHPVIRGLGPQRVGPRRPEYRPAARQYPAHRLDVERHRVAFERPAPAVAEPNELEAVLLHSATHDGTDHRVQARAVPASGQHSHSHGGKTSAHERPRD
jgi:hypothetical protein